MRIVIACMESARQGEWRRFASGCMRTCNAEPPERAEEQRAPRQHHGGLRKQAGKEANGHRSEHTHKTRRFLKVSNTGTYSGLATGHMALQRSHKAQQARALPSTSHQVVAVTITRGPPAHLHLGALLREERRRRGADGGGRTALRGDVPQHPQLLLRDQQRDVVHHQGGQQRSGAPGGPAFQ